MYLKLEALQPSGSFKNRGIGRLCTYYVQDDREIDTFVSSSRGNAGLGVAYAGRYLNIPVKVVVSATNQRMIDKIREEETKVNVFFVGGRGPCCVESCRDYKG